MSAATSPAIPTIPEDAAQVTFFVLSKHARSIRHGESLANWLFGTARRVAARAVRDSARRRRHEQRYAETVAVHRRPEEPHDIGDREWSGLYEELGRLPDRYRAPIILCDLEGRTHEQAAIALGCPARTLQTRLYRGRQRLRQRLLRRGLLPAAGLVGCSLSAEAGSAALPVSWADATTRVAMRLAAGRAAATGLSTPVNLLYRGVIRAMFLSRIKWIVALLGVISASPAD